MVIPHVFRPSLPVGLGKDHEMRASDVFVESLPHQILVKRPCIEVSYLFGACRSLHVGTSKGLIYSLKAQKRGSLLRGGAVSENFGSTQLMGWSF